MDILTLLACLVALAIITYLAFSWLNERAYNSEIARRVMDAQKRSTIHGTRGSYGLYVDSEYARHQRENAHNTTPKEREELRRRNSRSMTNSRPASNEDNLRNAYEPPIIIINPVQSGPNVDRPADPPTRGTDNVPSGFRTGGSVIAAGFVTGGDDRSQDWTPTEKPAPSLDFSKTSFSSDGGSKSSYSSGSSDSSSSSGSSDSGSSDSGSSGGSSGE